MPPANGAHAAAVSPQAGRVRSRRSAGTSVSGGDARARTSVDAVPATRRDRTLCETSSMVDAAATASAGSSALERYEAVIGIEVHCQLKTASKMFCGCSNAYADEPPNTHVCPVCLGLPGTLPTINRKAVEFVLATGVAISAETPPATRWDRKNYFYPDLPKGYQISQYDLPLAAARPADVPDLGGRGHDRDQPGAPRGGHRQARPRTDASRPAGQPRRLQPLRRAADGDRHGARRSLGRAGARATPRSSRLCSGRSAPATQTWSAGQMRARRTSRCGRAAREPFGTRVEVKNMNSFRSVERAIAFEIERQAAALDAGETLTLDTRGWNEDRGDDRTSALEGGQPRLPLLPGAGPAAAPGRRGRGWPPIRADLPELPAARRARYERELGLSGYDAAVIVGEPRAADLFEAARVLRRTVDAEVARELGDRSLARTPEERSGSRGACRRRGSSPISSAASPAASSPGRTQRRSSAPMRQTDRPSPRSSRAGGCARSPMRRPSKASWTRSSPRTRRRSRTSAPASPCSASLSAR